MEVRAHREARDEDRRRERRSEVGFRTKEGGKGKEVEKKKS